MDRALKERIIGAIVLVVFVVLVVPVFLDGPPADNEMVSERVPLPGQEQQPVKVVVLDRDRSEPVPTSAGTPLDPPADEVSGEDAAEADAGRGTGPAPAPVETLTSETRPPEPEVQTVATPAEDNPVASEPDTREAPKIQRSAGSATGMWAVQLGSFSSADNANRLAADLRQNGFAAFLSKTERDGKVLHRVRIGPQKDRPAAEAMAARLKDAGHTGRVVPHP